MTQETLKDASLATADVRAQAEIPAATSQARHSLRNWLLPAVDGVLVSAVFLGVTLLGQVRILGSDGDTGWHLRLGNEMLTQGGLVTTNTLTSTAYKQPFIAWEWLSELIFAGAWRLFGLNGVVAVVGLVVALTSVMLLRAVRRRGVPLLLALPLTLAAIALTSIHWLARPHIFSLLLTLWWSEQLWAYWQSHNNMRKLWPLPVVMALWANLHGGFATGLVLLGTATALAWCFPNAASTRDSTTRRWQLTQALVACLLATLLTPWGLNDPLHLLQLFSNGTVLSGIQEVSSPDFHQFYGQLFLVLLLLLGAAGVLRGWFAGGRAAHPADLEAEGEWRALAHLATREPGALGWALVGVFTVMAFIAVRALPLWAVVVTPILGRELTCWTAEWAAGDMGGRLARLCRAVFHRSWRLERLNKSLRSGLLATLTGVFVLVLLLNNGAMPGSATPLLNAHFSASAFPVEAVQTIQRGAIPGSALPAGTGFTTIAWAGYLELTLPQHLVMIDSRVDFFDESVLGDYLTLLNGQPGWNQVIQAYGITWLLLPTTAPLAQIITLAQGWSCQEADTQQLALLCLPAPSLPVA